MLIKESCPVTDNLLYFDFILMEKVFIILLVFFIFVEKERSGELQMEYPDRLMFMAYFKQAKYGAFKEEAADCGWLDLVGNDAR